MCHLFFCLLFFFIEPQVCETPEATSWISGVFQGCAQYVGQNAPQRISQPNSNSLLCAQLACFFSFILVGLDSLFGKCTTFTHSALLSIAPPMSAKIGVASSLSRVVATIEFVHFLLSEHTQPCKANSGVAATSTTVAYRSHHVWKNPP